MRDALGRQGGQASVANVGLNRRTSPSGPARKTPTMAGDATVSAAAREIRCAFGPASGGAGHCQRANLACQIPAGAS